MSPSRSSLLRRVALGLALAIPALSIPQPASAAPTGSPAEVSLAYVYEHSGATYACGPTPTPADLATFTVRSTATYNNGWQPLGSGPTATHDGTTLTLTPGSIGFFGDRSVIRGTFNAVDTTTGMPISCDVDFL